MDMLRVEARINLSNVASFLSRLAEMKAKIGASQVRESDLFISFRNFDYSALSPLIATGHFHHNLREDGVVTYYEFMRFFNEENAKFLTGMLKQRHANGTSIDFLSEIESLARKVSENLGRLMDSVN